MSNGPGGPRTRERVEYEVSGIRGDVEDAVDKALRFWRREDVISSRQVGDFFFASRLFPTSSCIHTVVGTSSPSSDLKRLRNGNVVPLLPHQIRLSFSSSSKVFREMLQYRFARGENFSPVGPHNYLIVPIGVGFCCSKVRPAPLSTRVSI